MAFFCHLLRESWSGKGNCLFIIELAHTIKLFSSVKIYINIKKRKLSWIKHYLCARDKIVPFSKFSYESHNEVLFLYRFVLLLFLRPKNLAFTINIIFFCHHETFESFLNDFVFILFLHTYEDFYRYISSINILGARCN